MSRYFRSHRPGRKLWKFGLLLGALSLAAAACASGSSGGSSGGGSGQHFKIALSLSYSGNDWQNEAANLVKGLAATPPYNKQITLHEDIAGASVTDQITTLNNEIAAGYNAIIVYPISPTALNATIEKACKAGIVVAAYDSLVTAPCAYNVHIDQYQWGLYVANWLATAMHGHGQIADITGVPGTTVDTDRIKALAAVMKKYPGLSIAGQADGSWAQPQGKSAFESIYAAHPNIGGIYAQAACYSITQYLLSQAKQPLPCGGEFTNGHHLYMLPKSKGGVDLQSASAGSPVYSGELDLIDVVKVLEGQQVPKDIVLPLPETNTAELQADPNALGSNPAKGALVFPSSLVSNPGFFDDIWTPLVEEGVQAGLNGSADKISTPEACSQVPGCISKNSLTYRPQLGDWN
jgi:ribose transport system substrate-binding protein